MRTNRWLPIGGLLTVLVVLVGAFVAWRIIGRPAFHHETQHQTYNRQISRIVFTNMRSNDIVLKGRPSGSGVAVQRRLRWSGAEPAVREVWQGDTLTIDVSCPRSGLGLGCSVDFTVDLPANVAVDATATSGDITLVGMAGGAHVSTTSGNVKTRGLDGDSLDVRSTSGDLALDGLSVTTLTATATSGEIDATFSAPPSTVDIRATSGDVTIAVPRGGMTYRVLLRASSGAIKSDISSTDSGPGAISVRTTSSDITLHPA
ncbi:DUF4097 family beta strand repeat-containing protein [Rhizomonospora bruguierae]|uniref:DUF4097 family beta strand repeat-containing protein n=1 Tax=Rhizomonospora bruguierae TaxID=1581705 RepID=UPI001BCD401A|nr:DUF4097 family beta strand repeat-containing protein [Micromonospora sp. NBRC 107566]